MSFWTPSSAVFLVLLGTGAVLAFNFLDDDSRLPTQKTARTAIDQSATRTPNLSDPDQFCAMLENAVERAKSKLLDETLKGDLTNLADACAAVVSSDMESN